MRIFAYLLNAGNYMYIVYWQKPVMNVVVPYYYLEAKVVNCYCYLILSLK